MHRRDFLLAATGAGSLGVVGEAGAALADAGAALLTVGSVAELRRLAPRADALVVVRGHAAAGDGGGGLFRWDAAAGEADDGGLVLAPDSATGRTAARGRWRRLSDGGLVNARWFGARGDGIADDTPALQAALDHCQGGTASVLFLPPGRYRLAGRRGADGLRNGLLIRHRPPILSAEGAVRILGSGRASVLIAGADRMALIRCAADGCTIADLALDGGGRAEVWGLAVVPEDLAQTATQVSQQYNTFENLLISACAEAIVQQPGPSVGGRASGSFYNRYAGIHVYGCRRGVWLKGGPTEDIGNNRNLFTGVVMTNGCNTGVHIAAGDTNSFLACHFEGVAAGTAPSSPPTAVRIAARGGRVDNNANTFVSCKFEACTRDVDNESGFTEFYGCSYNVGGGKVRFAALPMASLGGYDPSNVPLVYAGLVLQHNEIARGFPLGCLALDPALLAGVFDKDGKPRPSELTLAETENVAAIVAQHGEHAKLNGMVEWQLRLTFAGTGRPGGIKIALPLPPGATGSRGAAPLPPICCPVAVTSGLPRPRGSEAIVLARFSEAAQSLAGRAFLAIPPPAEAAAFSAAPDNHLSFNIRYRA